MIVKRLANPKLASELFTNSLFFSELSQYELQGVVNIKK